MIIMATSSREDSIRMCFLSDIVPMNAIVIFRFSGSRERRGIV